MFGRATITLGIGPHSSCISFTSFVANNLIIIISDSCNEQLLRFINYTHCVGMAVNCEPVAYGCDHS